jgi:RNA polymerase sigma-70 factor, ECF subfamily
MEGILVPIGDNASLCNTTCRTLPVNMTEAEVNELFASCLPRLKKATRRMLRDPQDAEDALQDGLLLAFRKLHQFQGRSAFATWLHSIVRNSCRMYYRKSNADRISLVEPERTKEGSLLAESTFIETRPTPEEQCIQRERSDILRRATEELPAKYQKAITYFHMEGLSEGEAARKLRMMRSALKSQLHRSRRLLTARLRKFYAFGDQRSRTLSFEISCRKYATRTNTFRADRTFATRKVNNSML